MKEKEQAAENRLLLCYKVSYTDKAHVKRHTGCIKTKRGIQRIVKLVLFSK